MVERARRQLIIPKITRDAIGCARPDQPLFAERNLAAFIINDLNVHARRKNVMIAALQPGDR